MRAHGIAFDVALLSDPGRDPTKQTNEDSASTADTPVGFALVLCDGMGGHENGKVASETAVRTIMSELSAAPPKAQPAQTLRTAIEVAARAVHAIGGDAPMGLRPGSTCVAVLLHAAGAEIAHVGDSRIYLLRGGVLERLTRDHSMVQQMVDVGVLSEADAQRHPDANRITRALGMRPDVEVEVRPGPTRIAAGDSILLCSDGLSDMLEDTELRDIWASNLTSGPAVACQRLVERANEQGGHDNITVELVVIHEAPEVALEPTLVDVPAPAPTAEPRIPTLPDVAIASVPSGGVAPTMVDTQISQPERHTEPVVRFADSGAAGGGPEHRRPDRALPAIIVLVLLLGVIAAIAVRWARSHRPSPDDEAIPAPSSESSAAPRLGARASATVIAPEIPSSAAPEPSAPVDAGHHRRH